MRRLGHGAGLDVDLVEPPGGRPVYIALRRQGVTLAHTRNVEELQHLVAALWVGAIELDSLRGPNGAAA